MSMRLCVARALMSIGALGLSLLVAETQHGMPSGAAAMGLALIGAALAPMITGAASPLAVGGGAVAALLWTWLRPVAPVLAGASVAMLVFAARALRARDLAAMVTHFALAAIGGASATWVLVRHAEGDVQVRAIAIVTATLLFALPFALGVPSPRVHTLLSFARQSRGPLRWRLLRAAALERRAEEPAFPLSRDDRRHLARALETVHRLGAARVDAGTSEVVALERALAAHIAGITRLMRALRARWASGEALIGHDPADLDAARERASAEAAALDDLA